MAWIDKGQVCEAVGVIERHARLRVKARSATLVCKLVVAAQFTSRYHLAVPEGADSRFEYLTLSRRTPASIGLVGHANRFEEEYASSAPLGSGGR